MKILITTGIYPPEIGGPATYTALMEKELPEHGIKVSVLPFRAVDGLPKVLKHVMFLLKTLKAGKNADLLYSQDPVSVGFPTMLASKILGKPFLIRIAGDYAWEQSAQRFCVNDGIDDFQKKKYGFKVELIRFLQKTTARMANAVITPSLYFKNLVGAWNPSVDNVMTIYNGIKLAPISRSKPSYIAKTIISAGRLVPWKGFDFLITMMKNLPGWKLYIAGDGPDMIKLGNLIKENDMEKRVFLTGSLEREVLMRKIQECEIFILNTSFESFSFQVVEAMSVGTPVIATNIGNLSEIIENGHNGILVEPNDKDQILAAISKLQDQAFREEIIKNAEMRSRDFSIDQTVGKTANVIKDLIRKK